MSRAPLGPRALRPRALLPILLALATSACVQEATGVTVTSRPLPPLFGASQMKVVKTLQPSSQKFSIAVLTFVDRTGKAEEAEALLANMLSAALKHTGRFELYDRQRLTEALPPAPSAGEGLPKNAGEYAVVAGKVDGILVGYVTETRFDPPAPMVPAPGLPVPKGPKKAPEEPPPLPIAALPDTTPTGGELSIDFRIVNTLAQGNTGVAQVNEIVALAEGAKVRFRLDPTSRPAIVLDVDDVVKVSALIHERLPTLAGKAITVSDIKGDFLTLNVGEQDGVRRGFSGYVVEKNAHTEVYRYLAELVVVNVFPTAATAVLLRTPSFDPGANVKVGAGVMLK